MDVASFERLIRQSLRTKDQATRYLGWLTASAGAAAADPCSHQRASRACSSRGRQRHQRRRPGITADRSPSPTSTRTVVPMASSGFATTTLSACKSCTRRQGDDAHQDAPEGFTSSRAPASMRGVAQGSSRSATPGPDLCLRSIRSHAAPAVPAALPATRTNYLWGVAPIEKLLRMQDWEARTPGRTMFLLKLQNRRRPASSAWRRWTGKSEAPLHAEGVFTMAPGAPGVDPALPPTRPRSWPGRIASGREF